MRQPLPPSPCSVWERDQLYIPEASLQVLKWPSPFSPTHDEWIAQYANSLLRVWNGLIPHPLSEVGNELAHCHLWHLR